MVFTRKKNSPSDLGGATKEQETRNDMLALPGCHCLKGCNLLFHPTAFALRALEFLPFIFRNLHRQGEFLTAFITLEFIYRHI